MRLYPEAVPRLNTLLSEQDEPLFDATFRDEFGDCFFAKLLWYVDIILLNNFPLFPLFGSSVRPILRMLFCLVIDMNCGAFRLLTLRAGLAASFFQETILLDDSPSFVKSLAFTFRPRTFSLIGLGSSSSSS